MLIQTVNMIRNRIVILTVMHFVNELSKSMRCSRQDVADMNVISK
jgi:hypothetical protein